MQFLISPKTTVSFVEGQLRNEKLKIKNYFSQPKPVLNQEWVVTVS